MKAVILAAGKGVRMQPLTNDRPKQMVEVLGRPIIDYILEILPDEVDQIILVIGYQGEKLRQYLGNTWRGQEIIYIEQKELKGPYAATLLARPYLDPKERFFVIFADDFYDKDCLKSVLLHPRAMIVHEAEHPERFGVVTADADGKIVNIEEKPAQPQTNLVVTGAYLFDRHVFEYEPEPHSNGEYYFPPVITKMIKDYPTYIERAKVWIPIGYPEDIKKAEKAIRMGGGL